MVDDWVVGMDDWKDVEMADEMAAMLVASKAVSKVAEMAVERVEKWDDKRVYCWVVWWVGKLVE
jgi:hypothetical protein